MPAWKDLTGVRFGLLVATKYLGGSRWLCVCDCGGTSTPTSGALGIGNSASCGCRKRAVLGESTTKHGMVGSPEYEIWASIKQRCTNPRSKRYKDYGSRGITLCDRWLESFENFYADMGPRPEGLTLDRIDNDKGYSPDNCRWVSYAEQNLNKRNTIRIDGVPLRAIAKAKGCSYHTLYYRHTHGIPI